MSSLNESLIAGAGANVGDGTGFTDLDAADLTTGTIPSGRFPATLPAASAANLTAVPAPALAGTVPDACFPATLPAASGANLTALSASALASGTVPDARFPATLPALSGANLTALSAAALASGTIPDARFITYGAWSPSIGGNATYTTQIGVWMRVGRFVFVAGDVEILALGTGSTTTISGLPVACSNSPALACSGMVSYFALLAVNEIFLACNVQPNTSTINFASTAAAVATMTNAVALFGSGTRVRFSACYLST